jgi:hypothetical protein
VASPPRPGPLAAVHRITIGTAFLGSLAYLGWEIAQAVGGAGAGPVVRAALAFGVTVVLGIYFVSLRGLAVRLTPRE